MKVYSIEEAINIFKPGDKKSEVYGWPLAFEKDETFAFIVIYNGRLQKEKQDKWRVALHNKKVIISNDEKKYFESIDALDDSGPTDSSGHSQTADFLTIEQAIDYAISSYQIKEFMDYEAITQKYKERYWTKE